MDFASADRAVEREIRQVQIAIDSKMSSFAQFGLRNPGASAIIDDGSSVSSPFSSSSMHSYDFSSTTFDPYVLQASKTELEALLGKLASLLDQFRNATSSSAGSDSSKVTALQHYNQRFMSSSDEYRTLCQRIDEIVARESLLGGAGIDGLDQDGLEGSDHDELSRERSILIESSNSAENAIGAGAATRESLARQHKKLQRSRREMLDAENRFPALSHIVTSIRRRQTKNQIVLAFFIALLIFLMMGYILRKF